MLDFPLGLGRDQAFEGLLVQLIATWINKLKSTSDIRRCQWVGFQPFQLNGVSGFPINAESAVLDPQQGGPYFLQPVAMIFY